jgi:hypothetical protein
MNLDTVLWISGSVTEAAVIALLLYRRVWRTFPVFLIYSVWTLVGSIGAYAIYQHYHSAYITTYIAEMIVDSALLFSVLVELAWSALRPIRSSLSRTVLVFIGVLIFAIGAAIWPFASIPGSANTPHDLDVLWHIQQTFSILRVLIFLALAGSSQLLSIGWRDRELQIATGLGFTSLVGLAVAMIHSHQTARAQYGQLNRFVVASYLCSLVYWVVSFAQRDEARREFSPQMRNMLLAVAGAARSTRVAMADPGQVKPPKNKWP